MRRTQILSWFSSFLSDIAVALFVIMVLALTFGGACAAGHGRATTTTSYVYDDGMHPVRRESVTQTYSGTTVGANLPLLMDAGGQLNMLGAGNGGQNGSAACVLYPERCASMVVVNMPQSTPLLVGGGYGTGLTIASGGRPQTVGIGSQPSYGPPSPEPSPDPLTDPDSLESRFLEVEKRMSVVWPGYKESTRLMCQMVIGDPELVPDPDQRKQIVDSCKQALAKKK